MAWISIKDLSEQTGINAGAIRDYVREGLLTSCYLNGRYFVDEDSWAQFLRSRIGVKAKSGRPRKKTVEKRTHLGDTVL